MRINIINYYCEIEMYSLSTRMNVVLYNMMIGMVTMGFLNYLTGRYGTNHEI